LLREILRFEVVVDGGNSFQFSDAKAVSNAPNETGVLVFSKM